MGDVFVVPPENQKILSKDIKGVLLPQKYLKPQ